MTKENNKKGKESKFGKGCFTIFLIIFVIIFLLTFLYMKEEKEFQIKRLPEEAATKYISKINNYKEFSNKEAKVLSIKLHLLDECEGGQERIDMWSSVDQTVKWRACSILLKLNINKENMKGSKNELEYFKHLSSVSFNNALEPFQEYINGKN